MRRQNSLLLFLAALLLACLSPLQAVTLVEDFSYASGNITGLGTATGGWGGVWGAAGNATGRININSTSNLTYSGGGYNISQTGTGYASGNYGNQFRGINRPVATPMTGTIWFSMLIYNIDAGDHTGMLLNQNAGNDYDAGTNFAFGLLGTSLQINYAGTILTDTNATFALNTTHLIVGRITVGAGNDTLSLWADPTSLSNLTNTTPNLTVTNRDIGSNLNEVGFFTYSTTSTDTVVHGRADALRVSDGNGDANAAFFAVTGVNLVPEPTRAALALLSLTALLLPRRRGCNFSA
jgi:hypothetical protein